VWAVGLTRLGARGPIALDRLCLALQGEMFSDRKPTSGARGGAVGDLFAAFGTGEQHVGYVTATTDRCPLVRRPSEILPRDRGASYRR
jgi:hypothetical protein